MRSFFAVAMAFCSLGISAQVDSLKHAVSLRIDFGAESRQLSTSNMIHLGYDEKLGDEVKSDILNDLNGGLNLGFQQSWEFTYEFEKLGSGVLPKGFSVFHRNYTSLRAPADAVKLILNGNAPYAGQTLDLSGSRLETWRYTALAYHHLFRWKNQLWNFKPGILLAHDWNRYDFSRMDFYTEPDGRYAEVDGNYEIYQTESNSAYAITGVGLITGLEVDGSKGRSSWKVSLSDFGFAYFSRLSRTALDSNFRFSGIVLPSIESFGDSLLDQEVDELSESLFQEGSVYRLRLTPFRLSGTYKYELDTTGFTSLFFTTSYLHLPGYWIRTALGAEYQFTRNHELQAELAYGGFNALTLGLKYNWQINSRLGVGLRVSNLPAVAIPSFTGGSVLSLSAMYTWQ